MALVSNRVLVTGINSFTGHHLTAYLKHNGFDVYGTVLSGGDRKHIFNCDVTNRESCEDAVASISPDYVIHLAGIAFVGHANSEAFYKVNTIGSENLLRALTLLKKPVQKVLLASSATVYGDQRCEVLEESMCPKPANHYGISKLAMEFIAQGYFSKLPIIIVRPFNYTGVGQSEQFLIPKIVSHFRQRKTSIELGNLYVSREFNDVNLACDIYTKLLQSDASGLVTNLCSGNAISLLEIIASMNKISGYEIEVQVNPAFVRENEISRLVGSPKNIESIIGKIIPCALEDTLNRMYQ